MYSRYQHDVLQFFFQVFVLLFLCVFDIFFGLNMEFTRVIYINLDTVFKM